jgi:hypothetical protein
VAIDYSKPINRKKFMEKVKGDTGEKVLDKCRRVFPDVEIKASRSHVNVRLFTAMSHKSAYHGKAKSLRAALMDALKKWV